MMLKKTFLTQWGKWTSNCRLRPLALKLRKSSKRKKRNKGKKVKARN